MTATYEFDLSGIPLVRSDDIPGESREHTLALARRLWPEVNPAWLGLTDAEVWFD